MITFWMFESDGIKNLLFVESMTSALLKSPCLECKIYDEQPQILCQLKEYLRLTLVC